VLRGVDGAQRVLVDPLGRALSMSSATPPLPGRSLVLSLDLGLQQAATAALATALRGVVGQPRGDQGAVVVMDAHSGQLLAMASLPSYDDNVYGPPVDLAALGRAVRQPGDPFLEHATQTAVPPGSTFKLVVAAADAAYDAVPPNRVVPTGAAFEYGGFTFHNWAPLGPMDLPHAIAWSNDVYFYKLALALGADRIKSAATAVGAGVRTGVDLPGEARGLVGTPDTFDPWYPGTTVMLGIGQGPVTATPLQVARWTAAAGTGMLLTPRLQLAAVSADAGAVALPGAPPQAVPFAANLGPVRAGLRLGVTEGTGTQLQALPVAAGGKTGSAQDPSTPGGVDAWYTAVAPAAAPDVVVTVMVRGGGEGFNTAEPVALSVLQYYEAHRAGIEATVPFAAAPPEGG
jgi:cell division protein FtsI/penicillin-binding protein 2